MSDNRFIEKYKSKSDKELERIAMNSKSFVLEARYAAVTLLKDRNSDLSIIKDVECEYAKLVKSEGKKTEDQKIRNQRLIKRIQLIPIKAKGIYSLRNGNELQVKRLNENLFQIRLEDFYRSFIAPVIICKVKDDSTYECYPFFYLRSILKLGIGGSALVVFLSIFGYVDSDPAYILIPILFTLGMQILLMPIMYFMVLNIFRKKLETTR